MSLSIPSHAILPELWASSGCRTWGTTTKILTLKAASYFTDPVCKVREYYYTLYTLSQTCKTAAEKAMRAAFLVLGILTFTLLTPVTAPIGIALRGIVAHVEAKPYTYLERPQSGKILPKDRKITLVSHNECYMPGGYCITDGQVTPPSDQVRLNANIQKIKKLNPDVICLYEVPDIQDASALSAQLPEYPFIIPVAGIRSIGPSSMLYVASKYEIDENSIEFVPFIKGKELTGRAQNSEKGFLSFDIKSRGEKTAFATVVSTHLQHSEIPEKPEEGEITSRTAQMRKIAHYIQNKSAQGKPVIFTGDLNQEEKELNTFFAKNPIHWLKRDPAVQSVPTWGGDEWCAKLMGKSPSGPLVLDYTFVAGKSTSISTKVIGTGYSGSEYRVNATSDHDLLFSTIEV